MYHQARTHTRLCFSLLVIMFWCAILLSPEISEAQSFAGGGAGIQLLADPPFPGPDSSVLISLDDYTIDTMGADISWYINGTVNPTYRNEREITIQTGKLGEKTTIRVVLSWNNIPSLTNTLVIQPMVVDVILETDTYVPDFYHGRALPSDESPLRAIAVVHGDDSVADTAYTYKWSMGRDVFSGGPVKGKNVVEFTPPLYNSNPILLQVYNNDGVQVGRKQLELPRVQPELHFYERSPLRGLSTREVSNPLSLIGEEVTIYGEPYFINSKLRESDIGFTWKINGTDTPHDATQLNSVTLRHVGGQGSADIGLSVLTKTQIPQFIESRFKMLFQ